MARPTCDFCRGALGRHERHRLLWRSSFDIDLVLADLCGGCASRADGLVKQHGGRGREAISLVHDVGRTRPTYRVAGFLSRGVIYLLVAVTFFLIVTLISSSAH